MKTKQQQITEPVLNFTIRFPQSLYKQVKETAIKEQKSISLWINEALEKVVKENQEMMNKFNETTQKLTVEVFSADEIR